MKKINCLIILSLLIAGHIAGQGRKGKTDAPSSAAPSSGSGSTNLTQGYHYKLPAFTHLKYKQITIDTSTKITTKPVIVNEYTIAYKKDLIPESLKIHRHLRLRKCKRISLSSKKPKDSKYAGNTYLITDIKTNITPPNPAGMKQDRLDTVSRYPSSTLHRVSVTQGDAGKLMIQFLNRKAANKTNVIYVNGDSLAKVHFVAYTDSTIDVAIPIMENDSAQNFYLLVKNKATVIDPLYFISLRYRMVQYGATTIPFRYRLSVPGRKIRLPDANKTPTDYKVPSEATANISLAAYVGFKFGRTRFYYDAAKTHNKISSMISFVGGPTLVSLTANNINAGEDINKYPSSIVVWSQALAYTLEVGPVNLGLFAGFDFPFQTTPWVYQGKLWLGFGVGFNIGMFTRAGEAGL